MKKVVFIASPTAGLDLFQRFALAWQRLNRQPAGMKTLHGFATPARSITLFRAARSVNE